jgi:hypothetical protein
MELEEEEETVPSVVSSTLSSGTLNLQRARPLDEKRSKKAALHQLEQLQAQLAQHGVEQQLEESKLDCLSSRTTAQWFHQECYLIEQLLAHSSQQSYSVLSPNEVNKNSLNPFCLV